MPSEPVSADKKPFRDRREPRRKALRAVFDARQKLTSTSGTRLSYDYELLLGYTDSRLASTVALPLMQIILALFACLWVSVSTVLIWTGLVIVTNLAVLVLCRRFKKVDATPGNIRRWTMFFVGAEALYGAAWSTLALFSISDGSEHLPVIMFAMLLVGVAANAFTTRALPQATLASTLPVTITVGLHLVYLGGVLNLTLAAVAIGGQIFFLHVARQLHTSEIDALKLRTEKDALIFELRDAQNMSDEARLHAEHANVAKSQFLATMSHELRTPLNAIIGFSEVLKSELLGPHEVPQYKEYAGDIHSSGQHLLNLINELLDLSRIEAGKYELNEEGVSLGDIASDCQHMLEIKAKARSIELVFDWAPDMPKLWGDERAIRQVILNLLSNAIKFTPQSGRIELSIGRSEDGGQFISVKDNGPGIPQEEINTVLSSFGQGTLAHKTAEQGAGLGLPIVQKIMDLHQGRFDLFSKLRFGTEVIATFPKARVMDSIASAPGQDVGGQVQSKAS